MSPTLAIELAAAPLERIRADLVVVAFAPGDRPLRGATGRADWRLCGRLSQLIESGKLSGQRGDAGLIAVDGGLRAPLLMALGLGPRRELDESIWELLGREAVDRALALRAKTVATGLITDAAGAEASVDGPGALLRGAAQALAERGVGLRLLAVGSDPGIPRLADLRDRGPVGFPPGVALEFAKPVPALGDSPSASCAART